jgi:glucosamine-6-phosphate deaminase
VIVENPQIKHLQFGTLKVEVHPSSEAAGVAAAHAAADAMKKLANTHDVIGVIFATGASQLATLDALTAIEDLPWNRVSGFHMDEYVDLDVNHPASFRRYLRERLTGKVQMKKFLEIDGNASDPQETGNEYAAQLRAVDPQLCLLGIGENGHLAFNDPFIADFTDPLGAKVVRLDAECRQQQVAEGWFESTEVVPEFAITLTVPTLIRVPQLILSVPGTRKAKIVRRALQDPISIGCPATILRSHPNATMYLDPESAHELQDVLALQ